MCFLLGYKIGTSPDILGASCTYPKQHQGPSPMLCTMAAAEPVEVVVAQEGAAT